MMGWHVVCERVHVGVVRNGMNVMKKTEVSEESHDDDDDVRPLSIRHLHHLHYPHYPHRGGLSQAGVMMSVLAGVMSVSFEVSLEVIGEDGVQDHQIPSPIQHAHASPASPTRRVPLLCFE